MSCLVLQPSQQKLADKLTTLNDRGLAEGKACVRGGGPESGTMTLGMARSLHTQGTPDREGDIWTGGNKDALTVPK